MPCNILIALGIPTDLGTSILGGLLAGVIVYCFDKKYQKKTTQQLKDWHEEQIETLKKWHKEENRSAQYFRLAMIVKGKDKDKDELLGLYAHYGGKEAQLILGVMYEKGLGVRQDDKQVVFWYEKAAAQGYALAQFALGVMYEKGQGVRQDDKQAVFWWERAVAQGYASAQFALGGMYYLGQGVKQDFTKAKELWEKSAAQGNAPAQNNLQILKKKLA